MFELDDDQRLVARTVREFVDREVIPVASEMEHRDEYPDALVETMKTLGLFGLNVPEEYGGNEVDYTTFAIVFEELSRGWMGLAGILGTHLVLCDVLAHYGTEDQKQRFLPRLAKGEPRGGICLSEPNAGTDLQAITTTARRDGDAYRHRRLEDVGDQRPPRADLPAAGEDRSGGDQPPTAASARSSSKRARRD